MNWLQSVETLPEKQHARSWRKSSRMYGFEKRRPWFRYFRFIAGFAGLVIVLYCLYLLIRFITRNTIAVALISTSPQSLETLPPTPSIGMLKDLEGLSSSAQSVAVTDLESSWRQLDELAGSKTLVIFLNLLANREVDQQDQTNDLFVYMSGISLLDGGHGETTSSLNDDKLPLRDFFRYLKSMHEGARRRRQRVLLLIDVNHMPLDPRLGNLGFRVDDAVRNMIEEELPAGRFRNFAAILSSSLNDGSHASIDLDAFGQTAFSHYCGKGLSGEADLNRDGRVYVGEFYEYLEARIAHWVTNNRQSVLLAPPLMIPDPANLVREEELRDRRRAGNARIDFELLRASDISMTGRISPQQISAKFTEDLEVLKPFWKDLESWYFGTGAGSRYHRHHPALWRRYVQKILYAERMIASGTFTSHREEWLESMTRIKETLPIVSGAMKKEVTANSDDEFVQHSLFDRIPDFPDQRADASPQAPPGSSQILPTSSQVLRELFLNANYCDVPGISPLSPAVRSAFDETLELSDKSNRVLACSLPVFRWVEAEYREGERHRRVTEDLLFVEAESETLMAHPASLARADDALDACLKKIDDLEKAHTILYRAIDELGYLARWRAHNWDRFDVRNTAATSFRRELFKEISRLNAKDANELLSSTAGVQSGNRLDQILDGPSFARIDADAQRDFRTDTDVFIAMSQTAYLQELLLLRPPHGGNLAEIRQMSEAIEKALTSLREKLNGRAKQLTDQAGDQAQPSDRIEILTLLEYPYLKAYHREKLLESVRRYEARLHSDSSGSEDVRFDADLGRFIVDRGLWHALWEIKTISLADHARAADLLINEWSRVAAAVSAADTELQLKQLHILAREIREFWSAGVATIDSKSRDDSRGENGRTEGTPLEQRVRRLTEADLLVRILPLYDLQYLADDNRSPARQLQQIQLCQRLLFSADRAVRDFWTTTCNPSDADQHWYAEAYQRYSKAAQLVAKTVKIQTTRDVAAELERLDRLKKQYEQFSISIEHEYTREKPFEFTQADKACFFTVTANGDLSSDLGPEGVPACGLSHPTAQVRSTPKRKGMEAKSGAGDIQITLELVDPDPSANCGNEPVKLTPFAFFRGHVWKGEEQKAIFVRPCREQGRFFEHLARSGQEASLLVGGESAHAVLFVLDCSYSMNENVKGVDGAKPSKFELAQKTLKVVIGERNEPQEVGLMVFAHRIGEGKRFVEWQKVRPFPNDLSLGDDVELLIPIRTCDQNQRKALMDGVTGIHNPAGIPIDLVPRGSTPSMKSFQMAGELSRRIKKPISVVMVTDGIAADLDRAAILQDISTYVEKGDIDLNVVLFALPSDPTARQRFNDFKRKVEGEWNGTLLEAADEDALRTRLNESLRPYTYTVRDELGRFIESPQLGRPVSKPLAPGRYQVTVDYFRNGKPETIELFPGQVANWRVDWGKRRLFRRRSTEKYSAIDIAASSSPGIPNLLLHSSHFHRTSDNAVTFKLGLDVDALDKEETDQQVLRPSEISFDVMIEREGRLERPNGRVTIQEQVNVPIPTWNFCIASVPEATSNIRVRAWWKMERTKPDLVLGLKDLEKPGGSFTDIPGTNLQVAAFQFEGKWEVQLQERDHSSGGSRPEFLLPLYRFELGQAKPNGDIDRYDNSATHQMEIIENDRMVKVRFPANSQFEDLAITTLESLRRDAIDPTDKEAADPENERGIVLKMEGVESTDTYTSCEDANNQ